MTEDLDSIVNKEKKLLVKANGFVEMDSMGEHVGKPLSYDPNLEGTYNHNNGTLVAHHKGNVYVGHADQEVIKKLESAGLKKSDAYVPFSNDSSLRKDEILLAAKTNNKTLLDLVGKGKLRLTTGRMESSPAGERKVPFAKEEESGLYNTNNGMLSVAVKDPESGKNVYFVGRANKEVEEELAKSGFKKGSIYVPFSNGTKKGLFPSDD